MPTGNQLCESRGYWRTLPTRLTLRVGEVDDGVLLEDVNLLNPRNSVHPKTLQGVLKPLVIGGGGLVDRLLLSARAERNAGRLGVAPWANKGPAQLRREPAGGATAVAAQVYSYHRPVLRRQRLPLPSAGGPPSLHGVFRTCAQTPCRQCGRPRPSSRASRDSWLREQTPGCSVYIYCILIRRQAAESGTVRRSSSVAPATFTQLPRERGRRRDTEGPALSRQLELLPLRQPCSGTGHTSNRLSRAGPTSPSSVTLPARWPPACSPPRSSPPPPPPRRAASAAARPLLPALPSLPPSRASALPRRRPSRARPSSPPLLPPAP